MKLVALTILITLAILIPLGLTCSRHAHAYVVDATETAAPLDAGVASEAPAPAAAPVDKLHDPVAEPAAAFDDLKAAKKTGWAVAVFAGLVLLCKLLGRAKKLPFLAILGKGKVAVVVGALGALGAACYNAAAEGGAWTAMLIAGVTAIGHYLDAGSKA